MINADRIVRFLSAGLLALVAAAPASAGSIASQDLGTVAPPAALGTYTMTAFGADPQGLFTDVTSVATPIGGSIGFSLPINHRLVGFGWATWSNGYTGDVYYSNGASDVVVSMPANTGAFYLYAEPNPFATYDFTVTANDGTQLTRAVNGFAGANGFGFYTTDGSSIASVDVRSSVDFGIGEFGIAAAAAPVPEPAGIVSASLAVVGLGGWTWRRRRHAAA
jgi:hypothetical protein